MTTKLIKLQDKFILVSDEERIEQGDWMFNEQNFIISKHPLIYDDSEIDTLYSIKIIAGIPELPSMDFSLLSEKDCKTIGWVDVEKLAIEILNSVK